LVRLPCFFNCAQRIERYSTTSSKMIKKWNVPGFGGHFGQFFIFQFSPLSTASSSMPALLP
jgi:hypothetical protein